MRIWIAFLITIAILGGIVLYGSWNDQTSFVAANTPDTFNTLVYETPTGPGIYSYELAEDSNVQYVVVRKVFGQADEQVTANASKVRGVGWVDPAKMTGAVNVFLDMKDMHTDNATRDEHVAQMFKDTSIRFSANFEDWDVVFGELFEKEVPGEITINSTTKPVVFRVLGKVDGDQLAARGSTTIKMTDFGIAPPSLVNVSTVDDNVELKFDIKANATN